MYRAVMKPIAGNYRTIPISIIGVIFSLARKNSAVKAMANSGVVLMRGGDPRDLSTVQRDERAQLADQRKDCRSAVERQALTIDLYRSPFSVEQQRAKQAYQRCRCRNGRGDDRLISRVKPGFANILQYRR